MDINWSAFKVKFNGKERTTFEQLSYHLFCHEHNKPFGIFRFNNQIGIETEPIYSNGQWTGFQSKYLDTSIPAAKDDIVDSIRKAKLKNQDLSKIFLYVNQEFAESRKHGVKDPQYKVNIESTALELGLNIEWRVPSHFEIQLALPENNHLLQYFFSLGKGPSDFLEDLRLHTETILRPIRSEIQFSSNQIKIDHTLNMNVLRKSTKGITLIFGEGGSGKTGLIKDFYNEISYKIPFYVFKAAELKFSTIGEFFFRFGSYSFHDFIKFHESQAQKFIVIDSAEKLSDLENIDVFKELLAGLIEAGWAIIFTTRLSYIENLRFQLVEIYRAHFNEISILNLSLKQLQEIALKNSFQLPTNERLLKLIHNPFYLNEYLQHYQSIDNTVDLKSFKNILWKAKVQQFIHKDNLHIQREETFMKLVKAKCDTGAFFLKTEPSQNHVLSKLSEDEIIKYDEPAGYFIAHDIYEEWALERIIEKEFKNASNYKVFFDSIGISLPMRRAFRNWLSECLIDDVVAIRPFIEYALFQNNLVSFWKDEILTSILLSDYVQLFFDAFTSQFLNDEKVFLNHVIFLLRTACKKIDSDYYTLLPEQKEFGYLVTRPKGPGWDTAINFLFENRDEFSRNEVRFMIPFLTEWVSTNPQGATTRKASLFILESYKKAEIERKIRFNKEEREEMESIILQGAWEIRQELKEIFKQVIENKWFGSSDPYSSLCEAALNRTYTNTAIINSVPESIIAIGHLFWYKETEPKRKGQFAYEFEDGSVEHHYAMRESTHRDYSPASALQSPIFWLLRRSLQATMDFILDFVNKTVENYAKSSVASRLDQVNQIDVFVGDGISQKQYISQSIWLMYRGSGSPVTPYLLQAIHMALEKYLLEYSKRDPKSIAPWLIYLLKNTKSASITSVVTSVVLAFPEEFFDEALILFNTYELYFYDNMRLANEHGAQTLYSIGYGLIPKDKIFQDERIKTSKDPHRQNCLERQIVRYQKFRENDTSEEVINSRQSAIWQILDKFYGSLPIEAKQRDEDLTKRLLLARIDGRKLKFKFEDLEDKILISFESDIEPELKSHSEELTRHSKRFIKYTPLFLWGSAKLTKSDNVNLYPQYENSPAEVLRDIKEVIEDMKINGVPQYSYDSTAPAFACAALVKDYPQSLSLEDVVLCKDIILNFASRPLMPGYNYQISDGVEAAVSALPALTKLCPTDNNTIKFILLLVMFDSYPIGEYKRVCDYAIEAIVNGYGKDSPKDSKSMFNGYLALAPKFNDYFNKTVAKRHRFLDTNSRAEYLKKFSDINQETFEAVAENRLIFQIPSQISIETILTAFQLVPDDTEDNEYTAFVKWLIPNVSPTILSNEDKVDYKLKLLFLKKFARFVLHRRVSDIKFFITPWQDKLAWSDSFNQFLNEFVSVEDELFSYEQFWTVWELLYPTVRDYCISGEDYRIGDVVSTYLLAWPWWRKDIKTWRSLKDREKGFFKKATNEMGSHPITLYSISKFLNEIGNDFSIDGLIWLSDIIKTRPELSTLELEKNTTYYLELFIRKFVYVNRTRVKTDLIVRNNVLEVLNFLISKGSVQAYLLREEVL